MTRSVAGTIAARFPSRFLQGYVKSKLTSDPVYEAALERLRDHPYPLLDVGCGVGLLGFYMRERGYPQRVVGIDHDAAKIAEAVRIGHDYADLEFRVSDARTEFPSGHSVVMLDLLHYFTPDAQRAMLDRAAAVIAPGGLLLVRDAIRDDSWRYRMTYLQESFSRAVRWLKAERLSFPTRELLVDTMTQHGFTSEVVPMWGRTPFNNYMFVFRRPSSGTTNV